MSFLSRRLPLRPLARSKAHQGRLAHPIALPTCHWLTTTTSTDLSKPSTPTESSALGLKPRFDLAALCARADEVARNARDRNFPHVDVPRIVDLHTRSNALLKELNDQRQLRNQLGRETGGLNRDLKKALTAQKQGIPSEAEDGGEVKNLETRIEAAVNRAREVRERCAKLETEYDTLHAQLVDEASKVPNATHPTTPIGDESQARIIRTVGTPLTELSATTVSPATPLPSLRDHVTLCQTLGLADFQAGATTTGTSFYYLTGAGALLELALVQYAIQKAVARGYLPVLAPDIVRSEIVNGCGFRPRDGEASQTYYVSTTDTSQVGDSSTTVNSAGATTPQAHPALCLAATAEIPLAGMLVNRRLPPGEIPKKMVAFGHCFRAEAGARGAETRGLYRVHQFSKVELFAVAEPTESDRMLEEIVGLQEEIIKDLGLCYRVLDMPTHELGASAYKKYDIEAWMPGRKSWGEVSSASNCTDYQARRLNIRYTTKGKSDDGKALGFAHTLNGTACAVPRLIIAILETFQTPEGEVVVPEPLRPWMGGLARIRSNTVTESKA
ncbi:Serine--tRNA ligase, mitochondrial [Tieghemiomyces parasiticus]|uniref:serine--tRNA ligase n=1 Tax=Tieghemiomyces parasiticus TaxID=78921 RepID=A0A9W7ZI82_9FUNG|nr:Serine--tRNA ligase, mitochondrial [Tieghemiomyces parasiticus]